MRFVRWTIIVVGVALATFLLCTYPLYLLYVGAGVGVAFALRGLGRSLRSLFVPWPGAKVVIKKCRGSLAVMLFVVLLLLLLISSPLYIAHYGGRNRRLNTVVYTGLMTLKAADWIVKHEIAFAENSGGGFQSDFDYSPRDDEGMRDRLEKCGWKEPFEFHFTMDRQQTLSSRWIPFKVVKTVAFPLMACNGVDLYAKQDSTFTIVAPSYLIGRTVPEPKTRTKDLTGDTETIVIPVESSLNRPLSAQFEIVSPLLRNPVGNTLLNWSAWEPLKGVLFLVGGIFSEQIRKGLLVPFIRWGFKLLHIPYKEETDLPTKPTIKEPEID